MARDTLQDLLFDRAFTLSQAVVLVHGFYTTIPYDEVERMAEEVAKFCKVPWIDPKQQTSPPQPFL